ncbi:hypothetical protein Ccrd_017092 [Cynara cardunculus var. scolymus]|uniref:Uncharacterized protein n=1 Tax=Cynara cardunculus var. scolymus TaxID=59895 RepID=A0A103Y8Q2_CYNCS|nr:hypothetical protein Ccrd_017092 [Cynara cardunculus var. scolymus]
MSFFVAEVIKSVVVGGITKIPYIHNGSRTGSKRSETANSYRAIETGPTSNQSCIHYINRKQPSKIIQYDGMNTIPRQIHGNTPL